LVFVGQPFDTIKVRIQTSTQYSGILDCAKQTFKRDGPRGFFRGMSSPLIGISPIFAICFWGYDMGKRISRWWSGNREGPLTLSQIAFAGAFSAIPTTLIMAPGERIKILLQVQGQTGAKPEYTGIGDVLKKLFREGGIRNIYKGTFLTIARDAPASAAYFGGYEKVKQWLTPKDSTPDQLNVLSTLFAGGMAGVFNWLVAIPADVLKSKYQSAPKGKYSGTLDVLREVLKQEGYRGLFKGLAPALLRAFPANAACFFGVEFSKKILNNLW